MKNNSLIKKYQFFRQKLMAWHQTHNRREMPWKGEKDPYKIWVSEIILQQTRVEQGRPYYERFLKQFPDVHALACAPEQSVMKCWEGLGYYSRCRNLIHAARHISEERGGIFPNQYEEILQLKGVGPYTAAAIASFAFNLPHAVVDGNVYRVLSRYHGIHTPIDSSEGKKIFNELAQLSLDPKKPGVYNQALMDFGATVCKPLGPDCVRCPLCRNCVAFAQNTVQLLPVKSPPKPKRERWFYYFIPEWRGRIPLCQRSGKEVWEGLWEPPLIESDRPISFQKLIKKIKAIFPGTGPIGSEAYHIEERRQVLSHQVIHACFIHGSFSQKPPIGKTYKWMDARSRNLLPYPKVIQDYWKKQQQER